MLVEPLTCAEAKKLIVRILETGAVDCSSHAFEEMAKDGLDTADVINVLRGGIVEPAEFENGSWRYRVRTARMCFVIVFRSETELKVVTAWRYSK